MDKKIRRIVTLIAIITFGILIYSNVDDLDRIKQILLNLSIPILVFGILGIQFLSYYSNAKFYQSQYRVFGIDVDLKKLYKISLALNFVNNVLPSVGASGMSFISYALGEEAPKGKSTFAQVNRYVLTYMSYILVLTLGGLFLYFSGEINLITVRIVVLLLTGTILANVAIFYIIADKSRIQSFAGFVGRVIDWLALKLRLSKDKLIGQERVRRLMDEFHGAYRQMRGNIDNYKLPFLYALLGNIFEVATVYIVFVAMGEYVNIGSVIVAYAVANIAGLFAVVGVYESVMLLTFTATGLPVVVALSATLIYRVFSKITFLPIGFYFYNQLSKEVESE